MNATRTMEAVNTGVPTLLVVLSALVILAIISILITGHVHVRWVFWNQIIYLFNTVACDDSCHHCVSCTSPTTCNCISGWTGSNCCQG